MPPQTERVGWCIAFVLSVASLSAAGDLRLLEAIRHGDGDTARALLKKNVDVNTREGDGATALHWAVRRDDVETVDLLLRAGAQVDAANDYGVTPLSLACVNRNPKIVRNLLAAGANPNAATTMGETALMTCARTGSVDAVKALVAHGAVNIDARETTRGQTALMWAAQGHPDIVRVLLEHGADVRARTKTRRLLVSLGGRRANGSAEMELGGFTPLLFAARHGDIASARHLLAAGADVNEVTPDGASALVIATFSGHGRLATDLLNHGADPNADRAGYAALHTAVLRGDGELVRTLLARGADPNVRLTKGSRVPRDSNWWILPGSLAGATPFLLAAKYAEVEIMRMLVANGADPLLLMEDGTTPLMVAAGATWPNAVNPLDRQGRYVPAHVAEALMANERPSWEAVKLTLELGADVNARNDVGDTALHAAVYKAWPTVVRLLVEHGGQLEIANKRGKTPRDLACYTPAGKLVRCAV